MSKVIAEKLLAGYIFGDEENEEYIYLPGGEVGAERPICVLEQPAGQQDLPLDEAARLVEHLSLRPCSHPVLGRRSY